MRIIFMGTPDFAVPALGALRIRGEARTIAPGAWACLDYGRGVWPAKTRWNWASTAWSVTSTFRATASPS